MYEEAEMYFSLVRISPNHLDEFAKQFQHNHYQLHQLLWKLFQEKPNKNRDFLFRQDTDKQGLPVFYVLSEYEPNPLIKTFLVETKPFNPQLKAGDQLAFSLRANPVRKSKCCDGSSQYARHDVVMHLKKTLSETEREQYSQAELEQQVGQQWLTQRAEKNGFQLLSVIAQGYQQHHFKKRKIKISTLDFDGVLQITDIDKFKTALYQGIGSAKSFGCGLILIKRA